MLGTGSWHAGRVSPKAPRRSTKRRRPRDLLLAHRDEVIAVLEKYGATQVLVFGSVARGEDDEESDIDLIVDKFDEGSYEWATPKAKWELEDLLGYQVDVGEVRHMKKRVLAEAIKDARPL